MEHSFHEHVYTQKLYAGTNVVEEIKHKTNRFVPHTGPTVEFLICYQIQPGTRAMSRAGKSFSTCCHCKKMILSVLTHKTNLSEMRTKHHHAQSYWRSSSNQKLWRTIQARPKAFPGNSTFANWKNLLVSACHSKALLVPCNAAVHAPRALFLTAGIFLFGDSMRLRSVAEMDEATGQWRTVWLHAATAPGGCIAHARSSY